MMNEEAKNLLKGIIIGVLVIALIFSIISLSVAWKQNTVYKTILLTDTKLSEISTITSKADAFYLEASFSYEDENYAEVESNCRLARGYYSDASQGYKDIEAELESLSSDSILISIYADSMEVLSEISWNMFEACEHFESASRYYDKYYNTDVPLGDTSFEMGAGEIEMMNEKIALHDAGVRIYNGLLSKYKVELELLI